MLTISQNRRRSSRAGCTGLTLVELLVSVALGLLLSAAMIKVYLDSKTHYLAEQAAARIQENGRFALDFLTRELVLAGFYGGNLSVAAMAPATVKNDCDILDDWALNASVPFDVINDLNTALLTPTGASFENCLTASQIRPSSDVIALKRTAVNPTLSNGEFSAGAAKAADNQWYLRVEGYGDTKSWVFIANGADLPGGDQIPGSRVEYWEMQAKIFYIRKYSTTSSDAVPTLCVERLVGSAMTTSCLVEGVEDMQLELGVDVDGDGVPDQYRAAGSATDLSAAVTARLHLLLRSIHPITGYTNTSSYTLGQSAPQTFNDGFMRRAFSGTVRIRNVIRPMALTGAAI